MRRCPEQHDNRSRRLLQLHGPCSRNLHHQRGGPGRLDSTAPANRTYSVMVTNADLTGKDFGSHGTYAITGTKFNDANGNGARDGGEVALPGWSIQLLQGGSVINVTSTVQDGSYAFRDLSPGAYTVSEVAQDGWAATMPTGGSYQVKLTNADVTGRDFGNRANLSVTGLKYYDINGNGVQDSDEPGITGSTVTLEERGRTVATTTTKLDGSYAFNNLAPGNYTVTDPAPDGLVLHYFHYRHGERHYQGNNGQSKLWDVGPKYHHRQ